MAQKTMLDDFNLCDSFDVMDQLENIKLPVQIIVSEKDIMTPVKYVSILHDRIANSELEVIKAGTHMVFAEQAELINKHIQGFMVRVILKWIALAIDCARCALF
jgi:pimeloyl-ACP methyl ester carboxylesterase